MQPQESLTKRTKQYDWTNAAQIKKWQADSPMQWLWESYQISTELYDDIKPGQNIDEAYFKKSIPIIHLRVAQAGIRLPGELNRLLNNQKAVVVIKKSTPPVNAVSSSNLKPVKIKLEDAKNAVGKYVTVTGKVYSAKDIGSMVLMNLGAAFPNQLLTIALKGEAKSQAAKYENKTITVEGTVIDYKGKPEIIISNSAKITL